MTWPNDIQPSLDGVRKFALSQVIAAPKDELFGAYIIAAPLLIHYLGRDWFARNVMPTSARHGFLYTGPQTRTEEQIHMWRLIEIAELLYNSAKVPGFLQLIQRARTEKEVESFVAELRVSRCRFKMESHLNLLCRLAQEVQITI